MCGVLRGAPNESENGNGSGNENESGSENGNVDGSDHDQTTHDNDLSLLLPANNMHS